MSTKIFTAVIISIVLLVVGNAVHHKYEVAKAQVSSSIDRIGPDYHPPVGQG